MDMGKDCRKEWRAIGILLLVAAVLWFCGITSVGQTEITQVGPVPAGQIQASGSFPGMTKWTSLDEVCAPPAEFRPFGGNSVPVYGTINTPNTTIWRLAIRWGGEFEPVVIPQPVMPAISPIGGQPGGGIVIDKPFAVVIASGATKGFGIELFKVDTTLYENGPWILELSSYSATKDADGKITSYTLLASDEQIFYVYNPPTFVVWPLEFDLPAPTLAYVLPKGTNPPATTRSSCQAQSAFIVTAANLANAQCVLMVWGEVYGLHFGGYSLEWWYSTHPDEIRDDELTALSGYAHYNVSCVGAGDNCTSAIAKWDLSSFPDICSSGATLKLRVTAWQNVIINDGTTNPPTESTTVTVLVTP